MFTGLIEATGRIDRIDPQGTARRMRVATSLAAELAPGDSIAVSGVCLTVVEHDADGFIADVSPETLSVTSLDDMTVGRLVNLERPLRADARLGGHFVLGHVDATGSIVTVREDGDCRWIDISIPPGFDGSLIPKGSVAVDGISLTVASLDAGRFGVQVIPFTLAHTSLAAARVGDRVNLEGDVLGKYVSRLLSTVLETGGVPFAAARARA
jgi:riboflavin synthase